MTDEELAVHNDRLKEWLGSGERCRSDGCQEKGLFNVFWPGQTTQMCVRHLEAAIRVARVMGFELQWNAEPASQ